MKYILLLFCLLFSNEATAQEKDSALYRYGFILDFKNEFIDQFGFKYKASNDLSYFIRAMIFYDNSTITSPQSDDVINKQNGFTIIIGFEYVITRVYDLSFFVIVGGGVKTYNSGQPYYYNPEYSTYKNDAIMYYSFISGAGVEYYFTKQFSLSGYQTIAFEYSRQNVTSGDPVITNSISSATLTQLKLLSTKIAITFYL